MSESQVLDTKGVEKSSFRHETSSLRHEKWRKVKFYSRKVTKGQNCRHDKYEKSAKSGKIRKSKTNSENPENQRK